MRKRKKRNLATANSCKVSWHYGLYFELVLHGEIGRAPDGVRAALDEFARKNGTIDVRVGSVELVSHASVQVNQAYMTRNAPNSHAVLRHLRNAIMHGGVRGTQEGKAVEFCDLWRDDLTMHAIIQVEKLKELMRILHTFP